MTSDQRNSVFVELFSSNYNRIKSFILTLVPNTSDAEDILQETSKVMWEKFEEFKIGTNFASWAITIAKFQVLSYRRKFNTKVPLSGDIIELLADESVEPLKKENERLNALRDCKKKLKDKDAKLLNYRFVNRKTAKELSKQIGVSMNTIYRNEARILSLLLDCVKRELRIS